jgi:hypothetical protein
MRPFQDAAHQLMHQAIQRMFLANLQKEITRKVGIKIWRIVVWHIYSAPTLPIS